jgi:hypothetical protein
MWSLIETVGEIVYRVIELTAALYDQVRAERMETPASDQPEGRAPADAEHTVSTRARTTYPAASRLRGPLRKAGQPFARRHPGIR